MESYPCKNNNLGCKNHVWYESSTCWDCDKVGPPDSPYRKAVDEIADLYGSWGTNSLIVANIIRKYFEKFEKIADRLKNVELSQTGWEDNEDIVLLNGKPIGATISKSSKEFDRW